ncbi:hypothetical protein H2200_005618 [Cladophialophora chaetospira]|uniref:Uncharacterized protein n=1 Tax=Cladophialophora chaetospira TaxID=386627 RepID=A0AA38XCX4_9EURO|nr:hypothetical protein H2200_005618 [Cladophialophora chaetospira]
MSWEHTRGGREKEAPEHLRIVDIHSPVPEEYFKDRYSSTRHYSLTNFNLISYGARAELGLSKRAYRERVHSIGGYTELNSAVVLEWHFRSHNSEPGQPLRTHGAMFYVLPPETDAKFDCILGRPWIEEHWVDFIAQVELNRRKEVA